MLTIKPILEAIDGGWQAYGHIFDNSSVPVATERYNAYDDKQEAWQNAKEASRQEAQKHNTTCKCGKTMTVSSY